MVASERTLKWAMRFYPPLLLQGIWVKKFEKGFTGVSVKIIKGILNLNYNRSIFGGTIFAAADPLYPILFHQTLRRKGYKIKIWVKQSEIDFIKPAFSSLSLDICINENEILEICRVLDTGHKFMKTYSAELFNQEGQLCAIVKNEIYIRLSKEG